MITFVVPAYNEAGNITLTVSTIRDACTEAGIDAIEIIVVNDGSSDGTADEIAAIVAASSDVRAMTHPANRGLGASIRAGIDMAHFPKFMVVPGDNDVSVGMLTMVLQFRDEADIILTAPLNKEQRNLWRNILSMFYQMAYMTVFDVYVSYINGPGIWPTEDARRAKLRSNRFSIISELNVKVLRMGRSFAEVPGYFQSGPKARRTVTLRNLLEVAGSFIRLARDVHFRRRAELGHRPVRKQIDFMAHFSPQK